MWNWIKRLFGRGQTELSVEVPVKEEPYVKLISAQIDPEKGIKYELDWNSSFISLLRSNGYSGESEQAIIQRWLAELAKHISTEQPSSDRSIDY